MEKLRDVVISCEHCHRQVCVASTNDRGIIALCIDCTNPIPHKMLKQASAFLRGIKYAFGEK